MTTDDALLDRLRTAATTADPVPTRLAEAARAALTWRTIDAELAELAYDSVLDTEALAGVRGSAAPRMVSFAVPAITVEVEVSDEGRRRSLVGQFVPPQAARVEIRHLEGLTPVDADELGRFAASHLPAGPVSMRCLLDSGGVIETDWLTI